MMRITLQGTRLLTGGEVRLIRVMTRSLEKHFKIPAQITVTMVGSRRIQVLNHQYRGKNKPTDVLSFGWNAGGEKVGDVILCPAQIRRKKKLWPRTVAEQIAHRAVHGVLHLVGYDHERSQEAKRMETVEKEILGFDPVAPQRTLGRHDVVTSYETNISSKSSACPPRA